MSESEKLDARKTALQMSRGLNPDQQDVQWGAPLNNKKAPPIEKVLSDADKIYDWIIKS